MSLIFRLNNRIVNVEANASFLSVVGDLDTGNATLAFKKYSPYGAYHKNPIAPGTPFSI